MSAAINEAKSEAGLTKEAFNDKKVLFEQHWSEVISDTEGCMKLLDDGEDYKEEEITDLSYHNDELRKKKNQFLLFEVEIERRINQFDLKTGEVVVVGTSQDGHGSTEDNVLGGKPTLSFIEEVEPVQDNEEVELSQTSGSECEKGSSSGSEKIEGG